MSGVASPCASRAGHRGGRDGFTLVEVLTAFVILVIFAVVVQRASLGAQTGLARADAWMAAETIARTLVEGPMSAADAALGRRAGSSGGHDWTLSTELLPLPAARADADGPLLWQPIRVKVRVDVARGATLEVETVRVVKAGSG